MGVSIFAGSPGCGPQAFCRRGIFSISVRRRVPTGPGPPSSHPLCPRARRVTPWPRELRGGDNGVVRGAGRWATVPGCCCDLWLVGQQARSRFRPKVVFPDAGLATMSCDCRLLPRGGLSRCAGLCSDLPDARLPCAPRLWGPRCPRHPRWRRPRPAGSSSRAVAHPRLMLPPVCCPPIPPRGSPDRPRGAHGGASRPQAPEAVHLTSSRVPAPLPRATAAEGPGPGGEGPPPRTGPPRGPTAGAPASLDTAPWPLWGVSWFRWFS